jgi:hypothetical protein
MTEDLNEVVLRYRDCARGIWNGYLRAAADWDLVDAFDDVDRKLFDLIVLRSPAFADDSQDVPGVREIGVAIAESVVPIMVERPSNDGNRYWDASPTTVGPEEVALRFVGFFDWFQLGVRDYAYVRASILSWAGHSHLDGREVLLEVRHVRFVVGTRP